MRYFFDHRNSIRLRTFLSIVVQQLTNGLTVHITNAGIIELFKDLIVVAQRTIVNQYGVADLYRMIVFVVVAVSYGRLTTVSKENLGLFGILLFVAMNIEVAACFHDYIPRAGFASISVLWALFATALMILGFARNKALLRRCSIVLFAATIIKVFVRDMANVDTPFRILSFLVLGLMLVGASYLYHRFKDRILPADGEITET